ncbi:S-layer homology domain-containing protein [Paenibacillus sp. UNCCL117]|uniref:S-layer homology domain-containing protein n=1 Tax=unclassified Paenibacillus TaxID=185978 RepID=UPI00088D7FCC|nr:MULTISPECIES: S-layer homology domain-containing protein [unclassified Paenibacillus]SDC42293.1 S-layer homology domain-containing protein [Paenibacillus sp. cl123]SFW13286.1 S-layer homology domain-containing protein [Paenibacillus sp. UNCCL117]
MKRKRQKQVRKMTAAALALTLAFSGSAFAAETAPNTTSTSAAGNLVLRFSDVDGAHWSIKHVTKLAALGIIQGYEKNEFRPDNTVSQQDVIVMAIRMMGLETEALANKAETVLPVQVSDYAKPYVAYAFDRGLITAAEEVENASAKTAWGSRDAAREWVAKLVIRAIGKNSLASQQAASASSFNDAESFSSWAKGYINAAVMLGIVQGFEDDTFRPSGKVTRAQMATFLSRADKELTTRSSRVDIGYVMELTDKKISVLNAKGDTTTYNLSADTVLYSAKDDSRIPLSQIKLTNEVYVIQNLNNALYIELTNEEEKMEVTEGTLNDVFLDEMRVSVQVGGTRRLMEIAANVAVTDNEGRGQSIGSIPLGSIVQLKRNTLLKETKITHIVVKQAPISKTAEGTITNIDTAQNQISFLEASSGQGETYSTAEGIAVKLQDGTVSELSKLHIGDAVSYEIKANKLNSVTVKKQADVVTTIQGTLTTEVSKDSRILTITPSGGSSLSSYYVNDNALVSIGGTSMASMYDLEKGDEVTLDLLNDKIVKVTVNNRQIENYEFASIVNYESTSKVLTVAKDNGGFGAYQITDATVIKYAGTTIPVANFQTSFLGTQAGATNTDRNKKVNMKVSKDKIISIEMTQSLDGVVSQINSTLSEVTLRTTGGKSLTLKAPGAAVELQNKTNGVLADLKVGDSVRANLIFTQDMFSSFAVKKSGVFKILVVTPSTKQVTVKEENGSATFTFTIDSLDKLYNPNKATAAFEDLLVDEYVKASFIGNKMEMVSIVNTIRGKVNTVDASLGTLTVQDFQGGIHVLPLGQNFTVKKADGTLSSSLTELKAGDRVQLLKDATEKTIIHQAAAHKRTVASYDTILGHLLLKPAGTNSKDRYALFGRVYVHKGTQVVNASSLAENNEVTIYVLEDKIYEIEQP